MQFPQHSDQFRRKYDPPTEALVGGFILRVLNPSYVQDEDYEAVMASRTRLHEFFGVGDPWPPETLSVEDNRRDLEWHADEFKRRSSFTYTRKETQFVERSGLVRRGSTHGPRDAVPLVFRPHIFARQIFPTFGRQGRLRGCALG